MLRRVRMRHGHRKGSQPTMLGQVADLKILLVKQATFPIGVGFVGEQSRDGSDAEHIGQLPRGRPAIQPQKSNRSLTLRGLLPLRKLRGSESHVPPNSAVVLPTVDLLLPGLPLLEFPRELAGDFDWLTALAEQEEMTLR